MNNAKFIIITGPTASYSKVNAEEHGRIRKAPDGFMQQYTEDLAALL